MECHEPCERCREPWRGVARWVGGAEEAQGCGADGGWGGAGDAEEGGCGAGDSVGRDGWGSGVGAVAGLRVVARMSGEISCWF